MSQGGVQFSITFTSAQEYWVSIMIRHSQMQTNWFRTAKGKKSSFFGHDYDVSTFINILYNVAPPAPAVLVTFSKPLDEPEPEPEANFLVGVKQQGAWPACTKTRPLDCMYCIEFLRIFRGFIGDL